jgi:hypothetical protein
VTRALQDFAGIISDILLEQRMKRLSFDSDFAKITVGLFSHLKAPLREVQTSVATASREVLSMENNNNNSLSSHGRTATENALTPTPFESEGVQAVLVMKDRIEFLSLCVENCLQLSMSLFQRLQDSEAADLVPVADVPLLIQSLVGTVTQQEDMHVFWLSLPRLDNNNGRFNQSPRHPQQQEQQQQQLSVTQALSTQWMMGVNISMLWMVLLSMLSKNTSSLTTTTSTTVRIGVAMQSEAVACDKPSLRAFLSLHFVLSTHDSVSSLDRFLAEDEDSSATMPESLLPALDYLLKSFGGHLTVFEDQTVNECTNTTTAAATTTMTSNSSNNNGRFTGHRQTFRLASLSACPGMRVVRIDIPVTASSQPIAATPMGLVPPPISIARSSSHETEEIDRCVELPLTSQKMSPTASFFSLVNARHHMVVWHRRGVVSPKHMGHHLHHPSASSVCSNTHSDGHQVGAAGGYNNHISSGGTMEGQFTTSTLSGTPLARSRRKPSSSSTMESRRRSDAAKTPASSPCHSSLHRLLFSALSALTSSLCSFNFHKRKHSHNHNKVFVDDEQSMTTSHKPGCGTPACESYSVHRSDRHPSLPTLFAAQRFSVLADGDLDVHSSQNSHPHRHHQHV